MPGSRIKGPEKHGSKYRVREIAPNGEIQTLYFADEGEARGYVAAFRLEAGNRSIGSAVTDYTEHLRKYGGPKGRPVQAGSLRTLRAKLVGILDLVDREALKGHRGKRGVLPIYNDRPLDSLTPKECERLYTKLVKTGLSGETHRSYLVAATAFGQWVADSQFTDTNGFASVRPDWTDRKKGKVQHTCDQARKFIAACYADPHPLGGIAAAAMLTLGTRSHEVLERLVEQLDDRGRVLDIKKSKSDAGVRRVELPPVLRSHLMRIAEGQPPGARLFRGMTQNTLLGHVRRLCEVAGVPSICAHGLRGTHVTLSHDVALILAQTSRAVGHASTGVTRAHYMAPGTEMSARAARIEALLLEPEVTEDNELAIAEAEMRAASERLAALRTRQGNTLAGTNPVSAGPTGTPRVIGNHSASQKVPN